MEKGQEDFSAEGHQLRWWGSPLLGAGQGAPRLVGGILQTEAADFGGSNAEGTGTAWVGVCLLVIQGGGRDLVSIQSCLHFPCPLCQAEQNWIPLERAARLSCKNTASSCSV